MCDFVWVINIFARFLTVDYFIESRDAFDIMWSYIKGQLFVDLVATIPTILTSHSLETHGLRILHLVFFVTVIFDPLEHLPNYPSLFSYKKRSKRFVIFFVTSMIMLAHWISCFWIWMGSRYLMDDANDPWQIANEDFHGASKFKLYVFSIYFVLVIFTSTGYGDYSPGTKAEYIFIMFVEVIGLLIFGGWLYVV